MLSSSEPTWDDQKKEHTCCGSKHSYHYSSCPKRTAIPGRLSDPDFQKVQDLKEKGVGSSDVAKQLGLPLEQVNDLWIL